MKFFTLLFKIYLLALSFFPCADVDSCIETNSPYISSINNKEDHNETENCTPFCICSCCALQIIHQPTAINENSKQIYFALKYPALKINFRSYSNDGIWQPPKFC
ncbi:MAG: hypothetical protein LH615_03800 [Ferruginibacter sp.]|nr:hypothetical protein [Ferruginibacter sp.]